MWTIQILLFAFITVILTGCSTEQFDLSQGLDVTYMGYDNHGIALPQINETDILKFQNDNWDTDGTFSPLLYLYEPDAYEIEVQPNENLSNGDTIEINVTINNESAKEYFKGGKIEKTVANLETPTVITEEDVWGALEIRPVGFNGTAYLDVDHNHFGFMIDLDEKYENVSNGDIITFEITQKKMNEVPGVVYEGQMEYTYEVSGLLDRIELSENEFMDLLDIDNMFIARGPNSKGELKPHDSFQFKYDTGDRTIYAWPEYEIINNGTFSNGDEATIAITQEYLDYLYDYEGLILPNNGEITVTIEGLTDYPEDISKVSNYEEVKADLVGRYERRMVGPDSEIITFLYQQLPSDFDFDTIGINNRTHNQPGTMMLIYAVIEENETEPEYYLMISTTSLALLDDNSVDMLAKSTDTERVEADEDIEYIIETLKEEGFIEVN